MLDYLTKDGDRLDQICHQHYGDVNMIVTVLEANKGLESQPPVLPAGLLIKLPDIEPQTEFTQAAESVWG